MNYSFKDHYKFVKGFIDRLELIVGHDWGGVLGFWYAFNYRENIIGFLVITRHRNHTTIYLPEVNSVCYGILTESAEVN
jgi:pimeloyl-ACP methyl ester carboxylesterase